MGRKAVLVGTLTILLVYMLIISFNIHQAKAESKTWIVDDDGPADFHTIQEAINAASDGDVIFVKNGVYYENPVVNKAVLLIGENSENTVVDGRQMGDVFLVTSSNVTITNLKIMNSSIGYNGVCLLEVQKCTVSSCNVTRNFIGIFLYYSSNNTLSNNNITDSWEGLQLYHSANNSLSENNLRSNMDCGIITQFSPNNTFKNNRLTNNLGSGILIFSSPNNILRNNSISGSSTNFGVWDSDELLPNFIQDIDTSNTVNGKPIYYWVNENNKKVPSDAGCVSIINSTNITVENLNSTCNYHGILFFQTTNSSILDNNITSNSYGIKLCYSSNNTISENKVASNDYGIRLDSLSNNNRLYKNTIIDNEELYGILIDSSLNNIVCQNNVTNDQSGMLIWYYSYCNSIYENTISNNALYGIVIRLYSNSNVLSGNNVINNWCGIRIEDMSSSNIVYHNNFINNTQAFETSLSAVNIWDDEYPSGGNYWSNYNGTDTNKDGLGDSQYIINANNTDRFPLMAPFNTFYAGMWDGVSYNVDVISNSTISDFQFNIDQKSIVFNVTGVYGTTGFCRVTIPNDLLWVDNEWTIIVGDQSITDYIIVPDGNSTFIYFSYDHSVKSVIIQGTHVVPEFHSVIILPLFIIISSAVALVFTKKKTTRKSKT